MEFCEKIQELRKQNGLTQEEVAQALFVSRTAVSKWESGRGYPNIDSLKAIAKFYGVTIDALLSGEELLSVAESEQKRKETQQRDLIFGLLDLGAALVFFLPFFGQKTEKSVAAVPLFTLTEIAPYLKAAYIVVITGMVLSGVLTIALKNWENPVWKQQRGWISLIWNAAGIFLFMISPQPYVAAFLFLFLIIKVLILVKKR